MLKKVLISVSLIALSNSLISCSYINTHRAASKSANTETLTYGSAENRVEAAPVEIINEKSYNVNQEVVNDIYPQPLSESESFDNMNKPKSRIDSYMATEENPIIIPVEKIDNQRDEHLKRFVMRKGTPVPSADGLKEITCVEVTYKSQADKNQTLGYIKGSPSQHTVKHHATTNVNEKNSSKISKPVKKKINKLKKANPPVQNKVSNVDSNMDSSVNHNANNVKMNESLQAPSNPAAKADSGLINQTPAPVVLTPSNNIPNNDILNNKANNYNDSINKSEALAEPNISHMKSNDISTTSPSGQLNEPINRAPVSVTPSAITPVVIPNSDVQPALPTTNTPTVSTAVNSTLSIGRLATFDYKDSDVEISESNNATLDQIADDLIKNPAKNVKIQSYAYSKDGNTTEARRNSLQRAIKVRKYLIDKNINASRISVNAIEDVNNKLNKVEITFEEPKN